MKPSIDIQANHLKIVQDILQKYLPAQTTVFAYGSRARKTAKPFSDLDLMIDAGKPLPSSILTDIAFDLEESDLPYKVDLVDQAVLSESFRKAIQSDQVIIWQR